MTERITLYSLTTELIVLEKPALREILYNTQGVWRVSTYMEKMVNRGSLWHFFIPNHQKLLIEFNEI